MRKSLVTFLIIIFDLNTFAECMYIFEKAELTFHHNKFVKVSQFDKKRCKLRAVLLVDAMA